MNGKILRCLIMAGIVAMSSVVQARTISDFESSRFYLEEKLVRKAKPAPEKSGEVTHMYYFQDISNPGSPFQFELTTKQGEVVKVAVHWLSDPGSKPATLTSSRLTHLRQMTALLDAYDVNPFLIRYVHTHERVSYPGGVNTVPWKELLTLRARAFHEGNKYSVILRPSAPEDIPKPNLGAIAKIAIGTSSNEVLDLMGKPEYISRLGNDKQGLLAEWRYPGVIYTMGRRERGGVTEYRVIQITKIGVSPTP